MAHARAVHSAAVPSLFSQPSAARDYRGFVHLALLGLGAALLRLAVENYRKYGLLLSVPGGSIRLADWRGAGAVLLVLGACTGVSFLAEASGPSALLARRRPHVVPVNVLMALALPCAVVWRGVRHVGLGCVLVSLSLVVAMKLVSYHLVLADMRCALAAVRGAPSLPYGDSEKTALGGSLCGSESLDSVVGGSDNDVTISPCENLDSAVPNCGCNCTRDVDTSISPCEISSPTGSGRGCKCTQGTASGQSEEERPCCGRTGTDARCSQCLKSLSSRAQAVDTAGPKCSTTRRAGRHDAHSCESTDGSAMHTDREADSPVEHSADADNSMQRALQLRTFAYFVAAPTLCFQTAYPRTSSVRWGVLAGLGAQLVLDLLAVHTLYGQYALPTLRNAAAPLLARDYSGLLERLLKLSLSSLLMWLCAFHALFHCGLNIVAEATRFGDRSFYGAWWNAAGLGEYWRTWNTPVHRWLRRHVYVPLVSRGLCAYVPCGACLGGGNKAPCGVGALRHAPWRPAAAQLACFLLSAAAHELLVAVPTRLPEGWAFAAMALQAPVVWAERRLLPAESGARRTAGNVLFWLLFCIVGQPACLLLYYRALVLRDSVSSG